MRVFLPEISDKTLCHIWVLFVACGSDKIFGRSVVENITVLKSTKASELLKNMLGAKVIQTVSESRKGKYRFLYKNTAKFVQRAAKHWYISRSQWRLTA